MITVRKMMKEQPWVTLDVIAFIVLTVLQLVSGQFSLQAPTNHVALSANVRVSFTMSEIGLSYPPNILLIDLSNDALRKSKSVPLSLTGDVTFECSFFDHAGTFQFRMQSTKNTSEILAYSNIMNVAWPDVEISVPTDLVASTREFQVAAVVTSNLCQNMRHNRYVMDMLLVYHGKNLPSNVQDAIPDGHGVVADSFPVGEFTLNNVITVDFGCRSADRAGIYTVILQSDFNQETVARSSVFEVTPNENYGVSVSTGGIYPNCSGAGQVQPIIVRVTQPPCASDDDTVRVLGQTETFSYTPSLSSLVHIMEKRIFNPDDSLQFFCSDFSEIYSGFCFHYVSIARSGAVDDQASVCIPLEYEGEPVDGRWSEWSQWGSCTATCGQGVRHRSRSCTDPSPANGGAECTGNLLMTEFCSFVPCITAPASVTPTTFGPTCYCGCTVTGKEGGIQSNPSFCENRTLFKWVIVAPDNHSIRLEFVSFYLAIHREYLRVRDGEDGDSPLLAYHTGVALPGPVSTTGNSMYIEYRVVRGGNLDQMGFSAVFTSQASDVVPPPPLPVGNTNESPVDVGALNNTAILIAGIVLGVLVVLFSIVFAVHARCSRKYDYKPGMPHDDTAETQLRGMGMGTSSINSSSTHHSRPWGAAPIGRSTTSQSEQSNQSTSKRGWPDGDRSQLYVVHDENAKFYREASFSSSHRSAKEKLPSIPSPYHEAELEKWTKRHGHKIAVPYHAGDVSRGSAGELSTSKHSGRTDRNTTHLAMKSPEEFAMTGIHESRTSMSSSKRNNFQETSHSTPQMQAIANVENTDNTSPYVNKDGQLTPLGLAVSKLNDNGMAFRIPEGAENPDQEKREYKERKQHRTHRHKDRSDLKSPNSTHSEGKKHRGVVHPEDVLQEEATPVDNERKLPVAPKMAFYSDDEPDWRPAPDQPAKEEDIRAETLPREKSREKSSHSKVSSSRKNDPNHVRNGAMSPHRTSNEEGIGSGHSSTLRSDKSGSLDRHGRHDRSRKPPVSVRHGHRSKKHGEKPAVPPRPDPHRYANHVTNSLESTKQDAPSYSLPNDHLPSLSDYSGQMSVEPSPVRLPRPLNRKQNHAQLTQVFISDESLIRPQSGAESSRSGTSHRQLPETPPYGFSPTRQQRPNTHRHQSDLSLSISQDEPEFDYYIPTVPGSFFENPYPMGPSERKINKMSKPKSPSASLI
nr:uncharacterized protein LOC129262041 [Lytechinus pictus]